MSIGLHLSSLVRGLTVTAATLCGCIAACGSLPPPADQVASQHFAEPAATELGRLGERAAAGHPGLSGVRILDGGVDAFTERVALIDAAQRSIDAQYYIWNSDLTGQYMAHAIYAAAERGVRVRLLLDDINVAGRDATIAALDAHKNIEIRIYNPFPQRDGARKMLDLVTDFSRLNRRMHNKSFTVDGAVTVVGGRNIGDEYFDVNPELVFRDRDVEVVGPIVDQVGTMFDAFWNSDLTYPISALSSKRLTDAETTKQLDDARRTGATLREMKIDLPEDAQAALHVVERSQARMAWAPAQLVYDAPPRSDAVAETSSVQVTARAFGQLAQAAQHQILIESAYLVLDDPSLSVIQDLRARGVSIRALTNSLSSNDVTANHAAYARRREPIVASGIDVYELRPDAVSCKALVGVGECSSERIFGLHAKSFVFDDTTLYVGSMNLNMRSAYLNAESALIIESPELAQQVTDAITLNMQPDNSWHVTLQNGELTWTTERDGSVVTMHREPDTPWWRRTQSGFIAMLPLEKYL